MRISAKVTTTGFDVDRLTRDVWANYAREAEQKIARVGNCPEHGQPARIEGKSRDNFTIAACCEAQKHRAMQALR